ncbi:MAG: HYR domain-containing protein [Fluviicola sp.]
MVFNLFGLTIWGQSQLPECTADVPFFNLDLSASPNMSYTTPEVVRTPSCCGDGDNYLSFYVTLHPDVAMFEIVVAPGYADPGGSGNYNIISGGDLLIPGACGVQIPGGAPICISGSGPHKILYSKPGKNKIKYIFRQIPKPIFPADQATRIGCSLPLEIFGLNNISITSINSSTGNTTLGAYNSLLSCTNCATPSFSPGLGTPAWIDYKICGTPQAAACGTYQSCDTVRLYTYNALSVTANPNPASFCQGGGGVLLTATAAGGDGNYVYKWLDSDGNVVSNTNTYNATAAGIYTAQVTDGLSTATCPDVYVSVPVNVATTPIVNAGIDQIVCASAPTVLLDASSSTGSGVWSGGTGTYQPNATSLVASYTPSAAEINAGFATLTFTSTGAGGGCLNTSDPMTITISDTVVSNPGIASISCYNGTATAHANYSGGTGPYTFNWSTGSTDSLITVSAGTYLLTVTDQYGCADITPVTVNQPSPLSIDITTTTANSPVCDGTASVSISGGTAPYSVLWSNGQTTLTATALCEGVASVTVTDNKGCSVTQSAVINDVFCNTFNVGITTSTDVSCHGGNDGKATVGILSGGSSPFTYAWSTIPVQSGATATNLSSGTYAVLVTDNLGCQDVTAATILQPTIITNTMTHVDVSAIGGNDGSATANPQGGSPGYTYAWVPGGQTTQTAVNLSSAVGGVVYHVAITDSKSCTINDSVLINQPPCNDFIASVNTTNITCNGLSNGSAYLVIANGTAPYSIAWSNGVNNAMSVSSLSQGAYTVTVTDSKNCSTFQTFSIIQPAPLAVSLVPTNVSCYNAMDGTIDLTVTGGTYPYTFVWSIGGKIIANHEDIKTLSPGTYSLIVTDANGCTIAGSVGITQPSQIVATYNYTDNPCHGDALGTVDMTVTGGSFPYVYAWSGPGTFTAATQDISGLVTGLYQLSITDLHGCTIPPVEVYINQPEPLTAAASMSQQVTCAGGNDGSVVVTADGGTTPYVYAWTGPLGYTSSFEDISGLVAGVYNVTVTDGHNCTTTSSATVTTVIDITPPVISCTTDKTVFTSTTSCTYTVPDLSWNATATDNCTVSSVAYTLAGATTGTGTNLQNKIFNKGVTTVTWVAADGLGNTDTCIFTVTVLDNVQPIITNCGPNPAQTVFANTGVCTYTLSGTAWDVSATDNCGIDSVRFVLTGATTGTGISLNGVVFNLGLTTITWTVYDEAGNSATCASTVTVQDNQLPSFISCGAAGTQTVVANTGECTYTHTGTAWNATATDNCATVTLSYTLTGATTGTGSSLNNVVFNQGTTTVTWKAIDGSGNFVTCAFDVQVGDDQDPAITNCASIGNQIVAANIGVCTYTHNNNTWNATATDNCTVSTLVYTLSGATTGTGTSLNGRLFNLGVTTVTWVASDAAGNTDTCQFTVTVQDTQLPIMLSCGAVGNQTVVTDLGECNFTQSGTGWDATANDNCSIASIIYTLTGATTGTGTSLNNVSFNLGTTLVTWTATDGSGNTSSCSYTVLVRDTQLPAITNCGATGNQNVTTDNGACTFTQTGTAWDATATDNCTVTSLTYSLSGATTGTGVSLAGVSFNQGLTTVTWTAIDTANNQVQCQFSVTVSDDEFPAIANCPSPIVQNNDNGDCGAIVNWTVPIFTDNCGAVMSGSHTPNTFFPVGNTTVTYTVVDNAGNTSTCAFAINVVDAEQPVIVCPDTIASCNPNVAFDLPTATDNCDVDTIIQIAGLSSGSAFPVGLTVNVFEVTDIHGNTATCSFTVRIYPLPVASSTVTDVSCFGFGDGSIDLTLTNGAAPYQTNWSNGQTTEDLSGLTPGTYTVGVTDNNGCTTADTAVITQPTALTLDGLVDNVSCYNLQNGGIQITVGGGTLPYDYNWSSGQTTEDLNGLDTGVYVLNVTDGNGCEIDFSTTITQPDTLTIQAVVYGATCNAANGSIQTLVTGGTTPYNYSWSNGGAGQNLNNVPAGTYTLDVMDAQGCQVSYTGEVLPEVNLTASLLAKDVSCYGGENGELTVLVSNGNEPYTYSWSNGATTAHVEGLTAGSYDVLITDVFGCTANLTGIINQPDTLTIDVSLSSYLEGYNVSSNGGTDGYIAASVAGGVAPYSYYWSNGDTTAFVDQLSAGEYLVVVTDHNNCVSTIAVTLTQPDILEMPQGFSPNADGENDFFVVHGIKSYPDNNITVFNRWGNIVYQKDGYADEWYGENNAGEALPDATYFVILKAMVGDKEVVLQGYVDVRRK